MIEHDPFVVAGGNMKTPRIDKCTAPCAGCCLDLSMANNNKIYIETLKLRTIRPLSQDRR